jgi:microcystin-dependent protein
VGDNFLGEIRIWGFDWAPKYWALCNGALLPVQQNQALFALLGTQYGGNGSTNFALPDMRGRVAAGSSLGGPTGPGLTAYPTGAVAGQENVTLLNTNIPQHNHNVIGVNTKGTTVNATGQMIANVAPVAANSTVAYQVYSGSWSSSTPLNNATIGMGRRHYRATPTCSRMRSSTSRSRCPASIRAEASTVRATVFAPDVQPLKEDDPWTSMWVKSACSRGLSRR